LARHREYYWHLQSTDEELGIRSQLPEPRQTATGDSIGSQIDPRRLGLHQAKYDPVEQRGHKNVHFPQFSRFAALVVAQTLLTGFSGVMMANDFSIRERWVQAPEMGDVLSYVLASDGDSFSFVPARGWQIESSRERRQVVLRSSEREATLSIAFEPQNAALQPKAEPELLRRQILDSFPNARILEEFPSYTSSHTGRGFQIEWAAGGRVQMASRLAYFGTSSGTIVFTLTAMADRFHTFEPALCSLLTSFQKLTDVPPARRP
jgi:hypothetical protein